MIFAWINLTISPPPSANRGGDNAVDTVQCINAIGQNMHARDTHAKCVRIILAKAR